MPGKFVIPKPPKEFQFIPSNLMKPKEFQFVPSNLMKANGDDDNDDNSIVLEVRDTIEQVLQEVTTTALSTTSTSPPVYYTVSGWIQNRRRFDGNITSVTIVDNLTLLSTDKLSVDPTNVDLQRLNCILHPEFAVAARRRDKRSDHKATTTHMEEDSMKMNPAELYSNLLSVGAKISVEGNIVHSEYLGKPVLWIKHIRLLQSTSRSVTIKHLLDLLHDGHIEFEEVSNALLMSEEDRQQHQLVDLNPTERQWKANEFAVKLQRATKIKQRDVVPTALLTVLDKYKLKFKDKFPIVETTNEEMLKLQAQVEIEKMQRLQQRQRQQQQDSSTMSTPPPLPLFSRGTMPGSKFQSKKRPQLQWMKHHIHLVLKSHP